MSCCLICVGPGNGNEGYLVVSSKTSFYIMMICPTQEFVSFYIGPTLNLVLFPVLYFVSKDPP